MIVLSAATAGGKVGVGPLRVMDSVDDSVGSGVGVAGAALQPDKRMVAKRAALIKRVRDACFDTLNLLRACLEIAFAWLSG
jgi:hypothetical protein